MTIDRTGARVNTGQFTPQEAGASQAAKKTEGTRTEGTGNRGTHVLTDHAAPAKPATGSRAPRASTTRLPGVQATVSQAAVPGTGAAGGLLAPYAAAKLGSVRAIICKSLLNLPLSFRTGCADDATQPPLGLRE